MNVHDFETRRAKPPHPATPTSRPSIDAKPSTTPQHQLIAPPPRIMPTRPAAKAVKRRGGYIPVIALAAALGLLSGFQVFGQITILLYAIASIWLHIPSRTTFSLALFSLGVTMVTIVLGQNLVAQNFAAYSFMFFAVAALDSVIEQWRVSKALRKRQQQSRPSDS